MKEQDFYPYFVNGTLVQANGDAGDSANRTGLAMVCSAVLNIKLPVHYMALRDRKNIGRYVRGLQQQYAHSDYMTRDQMAPIECAMVLHDDKNSLIDHLRLRLPRMLFHFSTYDPTLTRSKAADPVSPLELAVIIRGLNWYILWPLLLILDLFLMPLVIGAKNDGQLLAFHAVAKTKLSTPISWLAKRLLAFRAPSIADSIRNYYAEGAGRNGLKPLGDALVEVLACLTK